MLLEIDRNCNTILPAEDGVEAPPDPPNRSAPSWVRSDGPGESTLYFDFDNDFLSLHATNAIQSVIQYFQQSKASTIEVTAYRGSSKLADGTVMVEQEGIAGARATKVHDILVGLGVPETAVRVQLTTRVREPDGINDPWSRKLTLSVKP